MSGPSLSCSHGSYGEQAGSAGPVVYRLSEPSERAEFDRKVEEWGAKCYQATVELFDVAPGYCQTTVRL